MNTTSTSTPNRRIRRLAGRLALTAVAAGVIGAGPLAAVASADCPFGAPACPAGPVVDLPQFPTGPTRPDLSTIDPDILDDLVADPDGPTIVKPPFDPSDIPPGVFDPTPDGPGDIDPIRPPTIDPGLFDEPLLDPTTDEPTPGQPTEPAGTPEDTTTTTSVPDDTTTTTTSVPDTGDRDETATDGALAFTGNGTTLAVAGAGIAGIGALAVGAATFARRRNQL
jgi:hypothetical protein